MIFVSLRARYKVSTLAADLVYSEPDLVHRAQGDDGVEDAAFVVVEDDCGLAEDFEGGELVVCELEFAQGAVGVGGDDEAGVIYHLTLSAFCVGGLGG
jgi:hypothetical protein